MFAGSPLDCLSDERKLGKFKSAEVSACFVVEKNLSGPMIRAAMERANENNGVGLWIKNGRRCGF